MIARMPALLAVVIFAAAFPLVAASPGDLELPRPAARSADGRFVARIHYERAESISRLTEFDLFEFNDLRERYVLAWIDDAEAAKIEALGFVVIEDAARTADLLERPGAAAGERGIAGFPCYRTVEETFASAEQLVTARPDLAAWLDVGDSWQKSQGLGGYDLRVLRLTNGATPGPKPKLVVTSAIHAREYVTAELATRFGEWLVNGYGTHPEATWLLDHHEIHLLLHTNPDGRKMAEAGALWRKNTNQAYCGATSSSRGADLNRNFEFRWGCCGGSSGSACAETYRGPSAASEPEVTAVEGYLRSVFPDVRPSDLTTPAPDSTAGIYLDLHSYSELVLWPWGFPGTAPNGTALRTLGRKLAWFNGYVPQQSIDLYATDGTTIDFAYGELGVAAYVFEIGTSFFQSCTSFEGGIVQDNLAALTYLAKSARAPYLAPGGPDATGVVATPALVAPGASFTISATIDDTRSSTVNGVEPTQAIVSAELYLDAPPWSPGAVAIPLVALDGAFDEVSEAVTAAVSSAGLSGGRHLAFVRGRDASGRDGVVTAAFVWVADGTEGTVTGVVTDAATAEPLAATVSAPDLGASVATDPSTGAYVLSLPAGSWTIRAVADDHLPGTATGLIVPSGGTVERDFALAPIGSILLVDDDDNGPDVRATYLDALAALGETPFVWDTENSDTEPDAATLAAFEKVIWFTGDEFGGSAGPGSTGEGALAGWLDAGGCLLLASQDYLYDRGVTWFGTSRLGVASRTNDVAQTSVTGQGSGFAGFGPYSLVFPYTNYTDTVNPDAAAEVAFNGTIGPAATSKSTGFWRSTLWSFGLETIPAAGDRVALLARFLAWCEELDAIDGDGDGAPNGADCAPNAPAAWAPPSPARDLRLDSAGTATWLPPSAPGASTMAYDLLRSAAPDAFAGADCVWSGGATSAGEPAIPPPGGLAFYLVRAGNLCGSSLGNSSAGPRASGPVCP